MKLDSNIIDKTNNAMTLMQYGNFKEDIRNFEDVEKGELQIFLVYLWNKYNELEEKWNNLCDQLEYEEGWDPRSEDKERK